MGFARDRVIHFFFIPDSESGVVIFSCKTNIKCLGDNI